MSLIPPVSPYDPSTRPVETNSRAPQAVAVVQPNRGRTLVLLLALFAAGIFAIFATRASGQNANFGYDSIPMHQALADEKVVKSLQTQAKTYASTGNGDVNRVNAYFTYYIVAKMTAPDGVKHISGLVDEMNTLLLRAQRSNRVPVWQQLTRSVYSSMKRVAEGNHHPAARINAALVLSRLDSRPANSQARTPPVPLIQTFPILLALYQDENNVDGVRAAALQGMHRHAMYGFPQIQGNNRTALATAMNELLDAKPPEGRGPEAHAYLQRFAVDILSMLQPDDDAALGTKLISLSTEPENPGLIALYSASRLSKMSKAIEGQVQDPAPVLESWSKRILAAFEAESERFKAFERPPAAKDQPKDPGSYLGSTASKSQTSPRGGMGMGMNMEEMEGMMDMAGEYEDMSMEMEDGMDDMMMEMSGMGGMGGYGMLGGTSKQEFKQQPPEVVISRRKLNSILQQLHLGVTGVAETGLPETPGGLLASVPEDQKKVVEEWIKKMETIVTDLNEPSLEDREKYVEGLAAQLEALREFVGVEEEDAAAAAPDLAAEMGLTADQPAAADAAAGDELAAPGGDELAAPGDELAAP